MVEKKGAVCDAVMKDVCGSLRCLRLLALEKSEQVCFWVKACDLASHHVEKGSSRSRGEKVTASCLLRRWGHFGGHWSFCVMPRDIFEGGHLSPALTNLLPLTQQSNDSGKSSIH